MTGISARTYTFGPFRLEVTERRLYKHEAAVSIAPKVFDTLTVLVESRGRLIEKQELLALVWPSVNIQEVGLARNISDLRKILGDGVNGDRFIETVPKKGYRWVAEVRHLDEVTDEASEVRETRWRRNRKPWMAPVLAGVLAMILPLPLWNSWRSHRQSVQASAGYPPRDVARRGLIGTTITQNYIMKSSTLNQVGTETFIVVDPGLEVNCTGPFEGCSVPLSAHQTIDFRESSIRYQYAGKGAAFSRAIFNGFDWENIDLGGAGIGSVTLTTSIRGLDRNRLAFTSTSIRINLQGLDVTNGDFFQLDLAGAGNRRQP